MFIDIVGIILNKWFRNNENFKDKEDELLYLIWKIYEACKDDNGYFDSERIDNIDGILKQRLQRLIDGQDVNRSTLEYSMIHRLNFEFWEDEESKDNVQEAEDSNNELDEGEGDIEHEEDELEDKPENDAEMTEQQNEGEEEDESDSKDNVDSKMTEDNKDKGNEGESEDVKQEDDIIEPEDSNPVEGENSNPVEGGHQSDREHDTEDEKDIEMQK